MCSELQLVLRDEKSIGDPTTESSSRNLRVLCFDGGRSNSAESARPLLYAPANGGPARAEDAVFGLCGTSDRDEGGLAAAVGPLLLKASFVRMLSWPEFSLMCGGSRGGGEVSLLDIAKNEWCGRSSSGQISAG